MMGVVLSMCFWQYSFIEGLAASGRNGERDLISDGLHNMIVIMERNVSARERDYQGVF